ncbi:MAG: hypothetical protein LBC26_07950 [Oscillospiraceae bacterium]|nr:hypothetical protein [Oscillospiraceae bacterium]
MKKSRNTRVLSLALALAVLTALTAALWAPAAAAAEDKITITLNGAVVVHRDADGNEVLPFLRGGSTYLPVRGVAGLLGLAVDWDGETRTVYLGGKPENPVSAAREGGLITLCLHGAVSVPRDVDGNAVEPFIEGGSTFLPVRGLSSLLGLSVDWDGETRTVLLQDAPAPVLSEFTADTDNKIPYDTDLTIEGAASVERAADHKSSPYFHALDYYHMKSGGTLTLLENFKTQQQTTEWTCGTSAALMVLEYYGLRGTESDQALVRLRGKDQAGYSSLTHMRNIFERLGGFASDHTYNYENTDDITQAMLLDFLKRDIPVMVEWCDWNGHWQVVIGYDTMGTANEADDVLILADPYDTSDHWQDGYITINAERFFYTWSNTYPFDDGGKDKLFLAVWPTGAENSGSENR